jgi:hypothetical protein
VLSGWHSTQPIDPLHWTGHCAVTVQLPSWQVMKVLPSHWVSPSPLHAPPLSAPGLSPSRPLPGPQATRRAREKTNEDDRERMTYPLRARAK